MERCIIVTRGEKETKELAAKLASFLKPGDVLALEGDLGAGKTTFAKGLAGGLGIQEPVDSPTFTIIKEYEGKLPFYHMDVYRIEEPEEELGLEEYFYGDGICLVEWASQVKPLLPEETLWLSITVQADGDRRIEMASGHPRWNSLCKELCQA
ncbi:MULTISPECIES: tRNA (adenosine(37)-N6)-threonylcarbamoyltransferase complex ATPase subunit type 1 TsaE [Thermoactinomyces]|jgi:tRNA threonylcarbamoyladenosine biosynthesis protein TsaE|uniref:tRNA threonylcarbamoyladenosine biosynthesis protein TsaE n=1 Tax=Thermoactinomyces daqus TaxID=1329516 RepID=A0A7W1XD91_9BACL|nr:MULTISPECIES: tRNA (adenosine(37)-N6)-threonylcarbamoyltransferase complex ATPase subunit type 1 TsaE [Thermoactinomyces]MBA4544432.1 tRNA (adenosine(37)-N6)-threonylcarbamoyltransferase complex ATPase subunit type 1 TsaE [Thermoactinomyces daqus]MBH8599538.1 tRNA (adenosine(37)-N6)-threonylcarbamoyltransferase complex ATPase subunit type 1 TsaE [Thermoactinomyces sp. CICC 10523]MBH8605457.1 tRNA (adenosine(37)-N6)-threonylcarbamoyltransferase complex ATPase subunit type 1 TsaE [Thermoactinom